MLTVASLAADRPRSRQDYAMCLAVVLQSWVQQDSSSPELADWQR